MRIALLTYSTRARGGVVHTLALAEALVRAGQDVTVYALGRGGDQGFFRPVDARVETVVVPLPELAGEGVGPRIVRSIAVLRTAFDPARYDIVHAQDCISANAVDRCVRTVHHLDTFTTPELAACHERAIVEPVAHVCVSAAVAAELAAGWGIPATVIPNGVDAERFAGAGAPAGAQDRARWRRALGRYVLTVGGIEPRKGTLDLVTAVAAVRRRMPDVGLVIAGGETVFDYRGYAEQVHAHAAAVAVPLRVLGPVGHADLPPLMAAASAFAFPSTKEGFGLAAMEALAAGVPVVVRDLPVFREVFGSAVAYGADPSALADALVAALRAPDPQRRVAGRAVADSHRWDDAAAAHVRLYRSMPSMRGLPVLSLWFFGRRRRAAR